MSAFSNRLNGVSCNTVYKMRTFMTALAAAGCALLIRQADSKFWESTYNSGYKSCTNLQPSGVLVKTLMLNSGAEMAIAMVHAGGALIRERSTTMASRAGVAWRCET